MNRKSLPLGPCASGLRSCTLLLALGSMLSFGCGSPDAAPGGADSVNGLVKPELGSAGRSEQGSEAPSPEWTDAAAARFVDVARELGVDFEYFRGETGEFWPVEPVGGGTGWIDYDNDGWLDLVLIDGAQLPVEPGRRFYATRLYRNLAGERFVDVTQSCRLLAHDYGQGCAVADYDNDGAADLYVTNLGRSALYRNNMDGTFTEVTEQCGVPGGDWNTGATFADLDRDGVLDLYVGNYFSFQRQGYQPCRSPKGKPEYCGPGDSPRLADHLYRGTGSGGFQDVSGVFGDPIPLGAAFGAVAADLNNDGWPDLYVANDASENFLFQNLGGSGSGPGIRLKEVAFDWGCAVSADGIPQASMGIACADVDHNGHPDIALSHFIFEYSTMYLNQGDRYFLDASQRIGLAAATLPTMGWGLAFLDYDLDTWPDLFQSNGHINRGEYSSQPYEMRAQLLRNERGVRLRDVSTQSGSYFAQPVLGRGTALGDFNNDGRPDLAVVHHHRPAALLRNETETPFHSVTIELVGRSSSRSATNAKVLVWLPDESGEAAAEPLWHEVVSGDSYLSSNDRRIVIGLGAAERILRGEIRWPSGLAEEFGELPAGSRWRVIEGTSWSEPRWVRMPGH